MIGVIVLLDQFVWRPVIAWAEKFKVEQVGSGDLPRSWFLRVLRRSPLLAGLSGAGIQPVRERLLDHFARRHESDAKPNGRRAWRVWPARLLAVAALALICYGAARAVMALGGLNRDDLRQLLAGSGATFLRVNLALLLGALWTIPAGVAIGFHPRLARAAQPLAQIAASVPATALFPVILLVLIRMGGGLGVGSIALLLLGTQWYILFNVIAGARAIPEDLKEAARIFGLRGVERWKTLVLPGIFPYLVTGLVTASGGAWNASIVAEYFHFQGRTISTLGLGSTISQATDAGNMDLLVASTALMAAIVVIINRLVWRRMYLMAETKFRLDIS